MPAFRAELTGPYRFGADQRGRVVVYARLRDDGPVREGVSAISLSPNSGAYGT